MTRNTLPPDAAKRLKWPLRLTWAGMVAERAVQAFWPLLTVVMAGLAALMAGVGSVLPLLLTQLGGALVLVLALVLLVRGSLRFHRPTQAQALARLDAGLVGQPLQALSDHQAIGAKDAASQAVWRAHQDRMAARLDQARAPAPDLRIADRDPLALRYMALLALVMAAGFGSVARMGDLGGMVPGGSAGAARAGASWEGWIEPPAYTGQPSLYLNDQPPGVLSVPAGSRLTLRLYGRMGALRLSETVSGTDLPDAPQPSYVIDIAHNGLLNIEGPGGAQWRVSAVGDVPPAIRLEGAHSRSLTGELKQQFIATDDYGITKGQARISLDLQAVDRRYGLATAPEPRDAVLVDLPLPWRGARTLVEETLVENLSLHAWAELPVELTLTVTDAAGQAAASAPLKLTLPGRRFLDPLALALVEQRRDLMWSRDNGRRVAQVLRAISHLPEGLFEREATYLKLRVAILRLEAGLDAGVPGALRDEITGALWDIAVEIEDGNLADALARLRRAEERLAEAMRQGAGEEELAELMDELRDAMRDYMDQLAQNPSERVDGQAGNQEAMEITSEDLQAMMDRIEELMREGRTDEAMAMLDQLREMMENLQVAEGQSGEGNQSPGEQAMQGLQDTLREQQGLSDEAFRDLQEQANPSARAGESGENTGRDGGKGRGQSHTGEGGEGQGEGAEGDLAERQRALEDKLEAQRRGLPGAGTPEGDAAREALDQAGRAMGEAAEALDGGDTPGALDHQAEAMEAMREGMRNLDDAMAQAQRQRGQQGATAGQPGERQSDPLGRNPRGSGAAGTEAPLDAGEDVYRRARELMEELRRRSGEGERPEQERDYLRRLLDRF